MSASGRYYLDLCEERKWHKEWSDAKEQRFREAYLADRLRKEQEPKPSEKDIKQPKQ